MTSAQDSVWARWRRFRRLPPLEREVVLRAMALLPLTEAGLRVLGFRRWKRFMKYFCTPQRERRILEPATQPEMAERIARAAQMAARHGLGTPNCLERSLTLWCLLRSQGIPGELHIGARKSEARFEAHAWVELRGVVLNDSPDVHKHYARFDAPIANEFESSR